MKKSIEKHGFIDALPITLCQGKILDGKMQYRAARELGIAPAHIPAVPLSHYGDSAIEEVYANVIYEFLQNGRAHFPAKKVMRDWYAAELDCGQTFSCAD